MSDPILRLSAWQSPVFLLNSRLGLFTAAPTSLLERPFSRSYGAILPSSLTTNHSSALGYSPRLPVSVYGTGCILRLFLEVDSNRYHLASEGSVYYPPKGLTCYSVSTRTLHGSVPFLVYAGTGILTSFPLASPVGYALGPD